jgi:HEAT repeat protein
MSWWTLRRARARLGSPDPGQRLAAVEGLGSLPVAESLEPLTRALADGDPRVRRAAVEALRRLGARDAAHAVVGLLADEDEAVRRSALEALDAWDPSWPRTQVARQALPGLVALLPDAAPVVGTALRETLERIDPDWRTSEAAQRMASELEGRVSRRETVCGGLERLALLLAELKGADAASALLAGRCWDVLRSVADPCIAGRLVAVARADEAACKHALALLEHLLASPGVAVDDLVAIASLPSTVYGQRWVEDDSDNSLSSGWRPESESLSTYGLRDAAVTRLVESGRRDLAVQAWLPELLEGKAAAKKLDAIDPQWAESEVARAFVPRLVDAIASPATRRPARRALERIDPEWRSQEMARLADRAANVLDPQAPADRRVRDLGLLVELDPDRALGAAAAVVSDASTGVRRAAVALLARAPDARALDPLLAALRVEDLETRFQAAEALGRLGDRRAVPGLVEALLEIVHGFQPGSSRLGEGLAAALGRLGDPEAVEALGCVLSNTDGHCTHGEKSAAAEALAFIGGPRAADVLRAAANAPRNAWGGDADRAHDRLVKALERVEQRTAAR